MVSLIAGKNAGEKRDTEETAEEKRLRKAQIKQSKRVSAFSYPPSPPVAPRRSFAAIPRQLSCLSDANRGSLFRVVSRCYASGRSKTLSRHAVLLLGSFYFLHFMNFVSNFLFLLCAGLACRRRRRHHRHLVWKICCVRHRLQVGLRVPLHPPRTCTSPSAASVP